MKTTTLFALAGLTAASTTSAPTFAEYCATYGKRYAAGAEYEAREALYNAAVARVAEHNARVAPVQGWTMGINAFSDLRDSEFKALHRGFNKAGFHTQRAALRASRAANATAAVPSPPLQQHAASVDWAKAGMTTPVKNQGGCGSCWAFAGTEAIESAVKIATGEEFILAPQEFVDCAPNPDRCGGTGGCQGSTPALLFDYAKQAGAVNESSYKYTAQDGKCKMDKLSPTVTVGGHIETKENDYDSLMAAVAVNPVTIAVAAAKWGAYSGGVLSFDSCDADIDHAVLLVGYGTDPQLGDYWKVQNSWGTGWGEEGFIRLARSAQDGAKCKTDTNPGDGMGCSGGPSTVQVCGTCGILYAPSYPTGVAIA